jgi:putative transcriptional regulator
MRSIYQEIIDEGNEILESGTSHLRRRTREYSSVTPIKKYAPQEIKALRKGYQFTQSYFGELLGVSLKTVQAWEAGTNKPTGTALRLIQVLEQDPHALDKYLLMEA